MKQLFFVLVFLNVVYFFWGLTADETKVWMNHQVPLYKESKLETLKLISEDELAEMISTQPLLESKTEESVEEVVYECFMVGNFADESDANELSKALSGLVKEALVVTSETFEEFWVIYPSDGDWSRSLLIVKQLKASGVTDLWLVPSGSYKGTISLGLFKTADRAEKRVKEITEKLVESNIISREKYRYGVKLITNGDIGLIQSYLNSIKTDENNSLRKIAC